MENLKFLKLSDEIYLGAKPNGLIITGFKPELSFNQIQGVMPNAAGLLQKLPGLISAEYFELINDDYFIDLDNLDKLEKENEDPFEGLLVWSNVEIKVNTVNNLGFPDFLFRPRYFKRNRQTEISPIGIVISHEDTIERLTAAQAKVLNICREFNSSEPSKKDKRNALLALGEIQKLFEENSGIYLDKLLADQVVVIPEKISIDVVENGDYVTAVPSIEGVDSKNFEKAYKSFGTAQEFYDFESTDGHGRERVVFDEKLMPVLKAIKRHGEGLTGKRKEEFLKDPRVILPEDENINLDLIGYGPRVLGIGIPKFVKPMFNNTKEDWFGGFECEFADGKTEKLEFTSPEEAKEFVSQAQNALDEGATVLNWKGKPLPINQDILNGIRKSAEIPEPKDNPEAPFDRRNSANRQYLMIKTNEDDVDYAPGLEGSTHENQWVFKKPQSLKSEIGLKKHQVLGVAWLQNLVHKKLTLGGLLADEMGLGKTLQLLTFSAWLIEEEKKETLGQPKPPYEPILIIAPLGLLSVWENEIKKYFHADIFSPCCILHGENINKFRIPGTKGRETELAKDTLNLDLIKNNRLVITNYDTVKNFQYSFGKIKWSLVIVDEAQEIKEPNTATTHAIKALDCHFAIASTGTPVETNLINLWSLMDFVNPGNGLGCLTDFKAEFGDVDANDPQLGEKLRKILGFNHDKGMVLRRTKKEVLPDLPVKEFHTLECELTDQERALHNGIVEGVRRQEKGGAAALNGLQKLAALAQHPILLRRDRSRLDVAELLGTSKKLRVLIEELKKVQRANEKALVFARTLDMQTILKLIIDTEFGLNVDIVNGATATKHKYVERTRVGIVEKFSDREGFNVIILSPEVAGVGLTITAANHVFHYGRWWNPAKENQATDRAYRIGQTKVVHVYQLICKDPKKQIETFDEKLHRLLQQRETLADNFLVPDNFEKMAGEKIMNEFFGSTEAPNPVIDNSGSSDMVALDRVGPYEFEALVAIVVGHTNEGLYERIALTPKGHDGGVDVVCQGNGLLTLIQCKQTNKTNPRDHMKAIDELIDGLDHYRHTYLPPEARNSNVSLALATNGAVDKETRKYAEEKNVVIYDENRINSILLEKPVSQYDLSETESKRFNNIRNLVESLKFN